MLNNRILFNDTHIYGISPIPQTVCGTMSPTHWHFSCIPFKVQKCKLEVKIRKLVELEVWNWGKYLLQVVVPVNVAPDVNYQNVMQVGWRNHQHSYSLLISNTIKIIIKRLNWGVWIRTSLFFYTRKINLNAWMSPYYFI